MPICSWPTASPALLCTLVEKVLRVCSFLILKLFKSKNTLKFNMQLHQCYESCETPNVHLLLLRALQWHQKHRYQPHNLEDIKNNYQKKKQTNKFFALIDSTSQKIL